MKNCNYKYKDFTKKKSIYNSIRMVVTKLKLDLDTNTEYFHNVTKRRQIRINELAILLSPEYVICILINVLYLYIFLL